MSVTLAGWVERLVEEQADLSAVERFAQRHEPARTGRYEALLPARGPGPGEQYAFTVDLDACTGCKACVTACHRANGLDPTESFRSVGLLHGLVAGRAVRQTVTASCHHCAEPACLRGCPAEAYVKDALTGVVSHLDDQCIGCRYCTLTCPYEVPVYNPRLGIVRKCDMCQGRLAAGEAPACVQGCPTGAIRIDVVDVGAVRVSAAAAGAALVPGAPTSATTAPATRYLTTRRGPTDLVAGDGADVEPAHGHPPLAVMLVLTQVAVGALLASIAAGGHPGVAAGAAVSALLASVLHLGRPLAAWRAVLGLGHSWLSREIVAFSGFAALAAGGALTGSAPVLAAAGAVGVAGVTCSVLLYAVCGRPLWWWPRSSARFGLTAAGGGPALAMAAGGARVLGAVAAAAVLAKLALDAAALRRSGDPWLDRGARLLRGPLWPVARARGALGVAAAALAASAAATGWWPLAAAAALSAAAADLGERHLFFRAAAAPRMPGPLR